MTSELKKRWISAIIAIVVVLFSLFYKGDIPLFFLVLFIYSVGIYECFKLLDVDKLELTVVIISGAIIFWGSLNSSISLFVFGFSIIFIYTGLKVVFEQRVNFDLFFCVLYLVVPLSFALYAKVRAGQWFLVAVAACVWAGDAAAYFAGKRFGRRRLHPVSPKKTVEGALAGLLVGSLIFTFVWVLFLEKGFFSGLFAGIIVNTAGQIGDLFESYIKRAAGVKDSGFLFPGHGGVLDRIDSLLFALMISAIFF